MTNKISTLFTGQFLISSLILFCLILPQGVSGEDVRAADIVPDKEKRFCIHTVDGYAYLSEKIGLEGVRAQAFANAKRQARAITVFIWIQVYR